jgi:hypothetical protein
LTSITFAECKNFCTNLYNLQEVLQKLGNKAGVDDAALAPDDYDFIPSRPIHQVSLIRSPNLLKMDVNEGKND